MAELVRKKRKREHKYINGVKGAVSLFLIVLMLPFVQIAAALISAQKYNAAVSILDEVINSSLNSTLASYDPYVKDRFGLLTITQEKDAKEIFDCFLRYNYSVVPNAYNSSYTTNVNGYLPLASNNVLRAQIDEYAKYNSPVLLLNQFLNIADLLKNMEKSLGISNLMNTVSSASGAVSDIIDYTTKIDTLKDLSDEIYDLIDDYDKAHRSLKSNVLSLAAEMRRLESLEESLESALDAAANSTDPEFDNSDYIASLNRQISTARANIERYKSDAESDKAEYSSLHTTLIDKIRKYNEDVNSALESLIDVSNGLAETAAGISATISDNNYQKNKQRLSEVEKELVEMSQSLGHDKYLDPKYGQLLNEKAELDAQIGNYDFTKSVHKSVNDFADGASGDYLKAVQAYDPNIAGEIIGDLQTQKSKVDSFSVSSVTTETNEFTGYHFEIEGILTSDELDVLYKYFKDSAEDSKSSLSSLWKSIKTLVDSFLDLDLVYDTKLDALIDADYFMNEFGIDIEREDAANPLVGVLTALFNFLGTFIDITASVGASVFNPLKWFTTNWFEKIKTLLHDFWELLKAIGDLIVSIGRFLYNLVNGSVFTNLWYTYYIVFNLSCRTDYSDGKAMTGYSFENVDFERDEDILDGLPLFQDLGSLIKLAFTDRPAVNKNFAGAELEYMLVGSDDEIKNQSITFCMMFVFRLLCNVPVLSSPEVLALSTGPQAVIVPFLFLIVEAFVDTVLLVNTAEVPFVKTTAYFSASGIPLVVKELSGVLYNKLGDEKIQKLFVDALGYKGELPKAEESGKTNSYLEGLYKLKYKEYIFLIMFVFSDPDDELELYKNIIQMETLAHNKNHRFSSFDINKSFTALEGSVTTRVNEFMPQLLSDSVYEVTRKRFKGY